MSKIAMWAGFGLGVRWWQLGIEMRPFFQRNTLWTYPVYAAGFGSFGYWLLGVGERQDIILENRKRELLEKRARRKEAQREAQAAQASAVSAHA